VKNILTAVVYTILNFLALGIGAFLMGEGPNDPWFLNQPQAPWMPPGWVFGAAWTIIMLCFGWFMAVQSQTIPILSMYALQWILNVSWNPFFFRWHLPLPAFILLAALTMVVGWFFFNGKQKWAVTPYFLWLLIALSLNGWAVVMFK
jgi:benzodiazapine receptor